MKKKSAVVCRALLAFVLAMQSTAALAQETKDRDAAFEKLARELYPIAKQERSLIVYTVWDIDHVRALLATFSKRFAGIHTSYWQGTRPELTTRVLTEFQGNQSSVDIILGEEFVLHTAGAVTPYQTVQREALIIHDPVAPVVSLQIQSLAYNTRKLKPSDLPKSWEDVANPTYKGSVALDDPLRGGPLSAMLAGFQQAWKDDARWTKFVRGLRALDVTVHKSTSAMFRLLIAGEYALALPALLHDVVHEKEKGVPVDIVKGAVPVVSPQQAKLYAKAPHPNTAKLFAEWLVTPEGQGALDAVGRSSARKGFKAKTSIENAWGGDVKPVAIVNRAFFENPRKWLDENVKPLWDN
ncbi:MAG TPA: extracellular solute-binding protein [Candidatus Eisenbacteria bacterium]|nr:extracellular solute-binding protein [Candidatus Eisenbacteria bacterium]